MAELKSAFMSTWFDLFRRRMIFADDPAAEAERAWAAFLADLERHLAGMFPELAEPRQ